ncbi:MAG: hypothetical protein HY557_05990 [Euryarchaeota archaeon]|nr:hypothetical protein [Euryarchaeota archaeon]
MPTTIQVREETLERLKEAKAETGAASYDELISDLLRKAARRKTRFGAHPRMAPFAHGRTGHGD